MFRFIDGMAANVMAVEAVGKVTHTDYCDVLIPSAEAMMVKGPVRLLYVIGADFAGFELEALADDAAFGLKHGHGFSHLAVVSGQAWLTTAVKIFRPFFHGQVRLFRLADLAAAKTWITSPGP